MQYIIIYKYIVGLGLAAKTGISNQNCPRKIAFNSLLFLENQTSSLLHEYCIPQCIISKFPGTLPMRNHCGIWLALQFRS